MYSKLMLFTFFIQKILQGSSASFRRKEMWLIYGTRSWPRKFQPRQSLNCSIQWTLYALPDSPIPGTSATGRHMWTCLFIIECMFCSLGYIFKYYVVVIYLFIYSMLCDAVFYCKDYCCFCCFVSVECIPSGTTLETSGNALTCYPWVVLNE